MKVKSHRLQMPLVLAGIAILVLPVALVLMSFLHRFLLAGRDLRTEPLLLSLFALAALTLSLVLISAGVIAFLASLSAIRSRFPRVRQAAAEPSQAPTGTDRLAAEWLDKAAALLSSQQFREALHSLPTARKFALQNPTSPTSQAFNQMRQERLAAARTALRAGQIRDAYRESLIASAFGDLSFQDQALVVACQILHGDRTPLSSILRQPEKLGHDQEAFRLLVKHYAETVPPAKWDELPVERVLDSFDEANISLTVPFRLTPEERSSLAPLLESSRPKAGEDSVFEFTGLDAKAIALRKVLLCALALTPKWFPTKELSRLLWVAAETLIHEPANTELDRVCPTVTLDQRRWLGRWARTSISRQTAPSPMSLSR